MEAPCKLNSNLAHILFYYVQEGRGEAFYEIGVHDNGKLVGIEREQVFETMLYLFHMAQELSATLSINLVR